MAKSALSKLKACPKGYTSKTGHICRPCPTNTYGERCKHECSCSVFEICNIVEGCVEIPTTPTFQTTTEIRVHETFHITTFRKDPAGSTNGKTRNTSVDGLLSTEIIVIFALSAIVIVFGVCLCFILYKYKLSQKKKKRTIIRSPIPPLPQNDQPIASEYRLYDIINEADLLDDNDLQQIRKSADYLDVISTGSDDSSNMVNHDPIALTNKQENCSVSSGNHTSSSDENNQEVTEGYLNPYQPIIKMSPPTKKEYLTLATVHTIDSGVPDYKSSKSKIEYETKDPLQMGQGSLRRLYANENCSMNIIYVNPKCCLTNMRGYVSMSCVLNIERPKMQICSEKESQDTKSHKEYSHDYCNLFKTKSESDIFVRIF
ncbi:Hypothetical predicted protein [Mytilus galloprovincialis]|uniref:MEGF10_11 n=1 Tax=Mytilus galloprovincialis TaxID=29158 RepID=A0A8B6F2U1_MYTGA|nr:Hypothetical predicted protein [Mytilus galloprovincialis]